MCGSCQPVIAISRCDGPVSRLVLPAGIFVPAAPNVARVLHAIASESEVFGSAGFGSIRFAMRKICSAMSITFIIILSSTGLLSESKIGRGQPTIDMFEKVCIRVGVGMTSRLSVGSCLLVNDICITQEPHGLKPILRDAEHIMYNR